MGEADAVQRSEFGPVTRDVLVRDLRALGVGRGDLLIVHTSLSKLGWVPGGAQTVIEALLDLVGDAGTIVMPSFSSAHSDPQYWQSPPIPEAWWPDVRAAFPVYDPRCSPTRMMGAVADLFWHWPGSERSAHPQDSFAARGPLAQHVLHPHPLESGFGEESALGRLYELDGHVLLLGVGHDNNTSLHLAEHRADYPGKRTFTQGAALADGWTEFESLCYDTDDFVTVGTAFGDRATSGRVGIGEALWMSQRALVDFAAAWMSAHRVSVPNPSDPNPNGQ